MVHVLSDSQFKELVTQANLAPTVHNVQPARWRRFSTKSIEVLVDLSRTLPAADPHFMDIALSCGCTIEGMLIALSGMGYMADVEQMVDPSSWEQDKNQLVAVIKISEKGRGQDPLYPYTAKRYTWRSKFLPCQKEKLEELHTWAATTLDTIIVSDANDIAQLSALNDESSLRFMSEVAYRAELVSWMRLCRKHSRYSLDGMNLEAMNMTRFEGFGASIVLGATVFPLLHFLGLTKILLSEKKQTTSASAIALFHRPADESCVASGRAFYRFWLLLTKFGFICWPMAALADNKSTNAVCCKSYGVPDDHRFINALRLGKAPDQPSARARVPVTELICEE
ncbi:hypothetical protein [Flexibacterium corallicola]|uniref:hypothetical protein n=1 Tax=Flexibacterium corallicola TaxID=3037259 RepID=UPI00286EF91A|nr:hypothetical protein [Pseudovibrio sp. M1P-2-3]